MLCGAFFVQKNEGKEGANLSTIMDFAIGLSLVNGISGQINQIIGDFRRLDGVTDEIMGSLSQFKNISIAGGLLAGAGVKGLQMTADILDDCIDKATELQDTSLDLKIAMFGNDLLEPV